MERQQIQKKASFQQTNLFEPASYLQTRPFAPNNTSSWVNEQTETNLQTSTEQRKALAHNFGNLSLKPIAKTIVQPKLTIGKPNQHYEQKADKVASEVVQRVHKPLMPVAREIQPYQHQPTQGEEEQKEEPVVNIIQRVVQLEDGEELQTQPLLQFKSTPVEIATPENLETPMQQARGSRQPLLNSIQKSMEQAFETNFSRVKVYTDNQADQLNQLIQAKAFTSV